MYVKDTCRWVIHAFINNRKIFVLSVHIFLNAYICKKKLINLDAFHKKIHMWFLISDDIIKYGCNKKTGALTANQSIELLFALMNSLWFDL